MRIGLIENIIHDNLISIYKETFCLWKSKVKIIIAQKEKTVKVEDNLIVGFGKISYKAVVKVKAVADYLGSLTITMISMLD